METLYYHGAVRTMADGTPAEALLVTDGIVAGAGTYEALRSAAEPSCRRVDLQGCALLPAFVDAHSHITAYARTLGSVQLSGAQSFDEIVRRIRDFVRETRPEAGAYLSAFGYDQNILREGAHPTRAVLDAACPDIPLIASHASGHMGVLNSAALRALGVTRDTPDPSGGRIGRDADGEPTGYLEENAFMQVGARVPQPDEAARLTGLERAQTEYLKRGVATIQDGLTRAEDWSLLSAFAAQGRLRADVVCYADLKNDPALLREASREYRGRLRMGGGKIFLDGSPQGRTAWLTQPYLQAAEREGDAGYRGYPTYGDEEVYGFVAQCCRAGVQLLAHCNGDAAAEQLICACERARADGLDVAAIRPVMIHAQLVRPDQLRRMAPLGMTASFFVAHTWFWGDAHLANLGAARAREISPAASALREGVPFTFHQDTPVLPPDMLQTVWCAARRVTRAGARLDPAERVPVEAGLQAVTRTAAWQYFEEARKGALTPGRTADLVVLDRDPLAVPEEEVREVRVLATIKDGECVWQEDA